MPGSASDDSAAILARVTRSGEPESLHRGSVVITKDDAVLHAWGNPDTPVFTRSAVKPFQMLPFLERGLADRYGVSPAELAVLVASHSGTPEHVAIVRGLMKKLGVEEGELRCGPHAPYDVQASIAIARAGEKPKPVHNNCSGKHVGFVRLARELGTDVERYLDPATPAQLEVKAAVRTMTGAAEGDLFVGIDGCGAPTFRMPLVALARGFGRLATPTGCPPQRVAALRAMLGAVTAFPRVFSGAGRLEEALLTALPGRIFPKNGAEGIYAIGLAGTGLGVAIKVDDGNERGYFPVVVALLQRLGVISDVPEVLERFRRLPIVNTQKLVVGHVESALS
ncbi:MAG: asparaginase [Myxococcota bacterium]